MSDAADFLHADKHESLLKIDTNIFWWVQSSIPKVLKIASLKCLYNISKNVMNGVHFGVHQDQNFYKLDYWFLMKVARHVQSTQKIKFVKFLQL